MTLPPSIADAYRLLIAEFQDESATLEKRVAALSGMAQMQTETFLLFGEGAWRELRALEMDVSNA